MTANESAHTYVITVVHGTFDSNPKWTRPDSWFAKTLHSMLDGDVRIEPFRWSGSNSHTARIRAGRELARHLRDTADAHPRSHHFIVAHSHGGNVALYALHDRSTHECTRGVVCLATPFVQVRKREHRFFSAIKVVWGLSAFILCFAITAVPIELMGWELQSEVLLVGFSLGSLLGGLVLADFGWDICDRLEHHAERRAHELILSRLSDRIPMLAIRLKRDEAEIWLRTLLHISTLMERVWDLLEWSLNRLYPIFVFGVCGGSFIAIALEELESAGFDNRWLETMLVIVVLSAPIVFLVSLPVFLGAWLLDSVVRGSMIGFGEGALDSVVLRTEFRRRDSSEIGVGLRARSPLRGFRHSLVYDRDEVAEYVARWIKAHSAATERRSSTSVEYF